LTDIKTLTRSDLFLDEVTLDHHFSSLDQRVGSIPTHKGSRFAQSVARRITLRLGRQFEHRLQIPAQVLAEAWYFPVWCELCTLIPLRHLARRIAKIAKNDLILVLLNSNTGTYLSYWERSSLEPLLLVYALRKAGAAVALVLEASAQTFVFQLRPHPIWSRTPILRPSSPGGKKAVVLAGMRGVPQMLARVGDPLLVHAAFSESISGFHETLWQSSPLPTVELNFVKEPQSNALPYFVHHFSCDLPRIMLSDWLFYAIGARTRTAATTASRLVMDYAIEEAHVCDHMFFEAALLAHAVRASGGRVIVWPHSSNAIHVDVRRLAKPDHVHCITKSSAEIWDSWFKDIPCTIVSELMLAPCRAAKPLSPGQPITVVVIAGIHNLNRMPVLDIQRHTDSYRRLFSGLAAMAPEIRVICKAKAPWESMDWLRSLMPPGITLEETLETPSAIDLPNMIFITMSFGSTAILEGLGRGIPSIIVRDVAVEDYAAIDPASVPIAPVETILAEIRKCRDLAYFAKITMKQMAWYESQTRFDAIAC
jgi:hypothetical protein